MKITIIEKGDIAIIKLFGKFNIEEVSVFEESISKYVENNCKVIAISLRGINYIDSSAIGCLIKYLNISKVKSISYLLYDLDPNISNIFKLAYLDKFFIITVSSELEKQYNCGGF